MQPRTLRHRYGHMAPTALDEEGFRFHFYTADSLGREPAHVHVERGDGEAKFWLEPIKLVWSKRMKKQEVRRARKLIEENIAEILATWREHAGR